MSLKHLKKKGRKKRMDNDEMKKKENIRILNDTLDILDKGYYEKDGKKIDLNLSKEMMKEAHVFLPDDIKLLQEKSDKLTVPDTKCNFSCKNIDALSLAWEKHQVVSEKILVLNFASCKEPGGQTRKGASAQEEDLCRKTSLLVSLESSEAKKYYEFSNSKKTHMGSDGIILSPNVEVIKDFKKETLSKPFEISVMSCSAPMIRLGLEGMTEQEYEDMLYNRIKGMLLVASSNNYRHLILGAFGCGIFGNDAKLISDLFYRVICDFCYNKKSCSELFDSIDFAVLCKPDKDYNYKEFCKNFSV